MYINSSLILHVVDETIAFQVAKWLNNLSIKNTWETLQLC